MVFLKSPTNVGNNAAAGAEAVPYLNREHFLGFQGRKEEIEHSEKN